MEILVASEDHLPVVNRLAREIWYPTYSELLSTVQIEYMLEWMYSPDSLRDQMLNQSHAFLLAKEGDEYLGFVSYQINYENTSATKIHKLYVLPNQHRKGLGARFVDEVSKIALRHGNDRLRLNMNKDNNALHFYNRVGFRVVEEGCFDIGGGFIMDDYILEKELKAVKA